MVPGTSRARDSGLPVIATSRGGDRVSRNRAPAVGAGNSTVGSRFLADVRADLAETILARGGLPAAVGAVNRALYGAYPCRVISISVLHPDIRAAVDGWALEADDLAAIDAWRNAVDEQQVLRLVPGGVAVPMLHHGQLLGVIRAEVEVSCLIDCEQALRAIGAECARLIHIAALGRARTDSECRAARLVERTRIAQDLHDSVGQLITGLGLRLSEVAGHATESAVGEHLSELLEITKRAQSELRDAIDGMLFSPSVPDHLVAALAALCDQFERTTGIAAALVVRGTPDHVGGEKETAVYRVAQEALVNIDRHSGATMVRIELAFDVDAVTMTVEDNGVGIVGSGPLAKPGHFGIAAMQRRLEDVGGRLIMADAVPHGMRVQAVLFGRRRTAYATDSSGDRR